MHIALSMTEVILEQSHSHPLTFSRGCVYGGDRLHRLQSLKYLLPRPLQKKFAHPTLTNTKKGGRGGIQLDPRRNGGREKNKNKREKGKEKQ